MFDRLKLRQRRLSELSAVLIFAIFLAFSAGGCASNKAKDKVDAQVDTSASPAATDPFDIGAKTPPSSHTLYALARILAAQERYTESISVLRGLLADQPKYVPAYNALAEVQLRTGQPKEAVDTLSQALVVAPSDPVLLNNLGMVWFVQERYEEALPYFEKAIESRPEVARYRANQAATLGMLGRSKEANAVYRRIMEPAAADENIDILKKARRKSIESHNSEAARSEAAEEAGNTVPIAAEASPPDGVLNVSESTKN